MTVSADHVPAPPMDLGPAKGMVYCKQCGWPLASEVGGPTERSTQPCPGPPGIALRGAADGV